MARRKGKPVSFDAMIKFFMQNYNIPTKKDIEKIMARIDRLETLINNLAASVKNRRVLDRGIAKVKTSGMTASDIVLDVVERSKKGAGFTDIQKKTGFGDKKLRNIIFRLHKLDKITRKSRGIYMIDD
jgi:uncharacterized protein (UPF0335 family)